MRTRRTDRTARPPWRVLAASISLAVLLGGCVQLPSSDEATPLSVLGPENCSVDSNVSRWLDCREAYESRLQEEALTGRPSGELPQGAPGPAADGHMVISSATAGRMPYYLVVGPSNLKWTLEGPRLQIAVLTPNLGVSRILLDRTKAGTGEVQLAEAGTHLLRIKAKGPWRIEVATRAAAKAGDEG